MNTAAQQWRSRIVGNGEADPEQLLANPRNWRIHPLSQQNAVSDVLDQVGWVQQVIVNETTGHLVDGHLRVGLAISRGETSIPVVYVQLTESEERLVLASLDPLAGLAATDDEMLRDLVADVDASGAALTGLLADLAAQAGGVADLVADGQVANDRDFWPVIRLQVSPAVYSEWNEVWDRHAGDDDSEKLAALLAGVLATDS